MQSFDRFVQGPYCLVLLAALGFTSVPFSAPYDELGQLIVWAGAFIFPLVVYVMTQFMPETEFEALGLFGRYPGLGAAALFLVVASAAYRSHPYSFPQDAIVSAIGIYILFSLLTVADLHRVATEHSG